LSHEEHLSSKGIVESLYTICGRLLDLIYTTADKRTSIF